MFTLKLGYSFNPMKNQTNIKKIYYFEIRMMSVNDMKIFKEIVFFLILKMQYFFEKKSLNHCLANDQDFAFLT